jgi:hypothetical protein
VPGCSINLIVIRWAATNRLAGWHYMLVLIR